MATGGTKMSGFNHYQNGKYGTVPQNPPKEMEITQDMHLKMSKKIAQLTKVIYALNTKNDEHESMLEAVKEQQEARVQQLLAESKAKLETYRQKLDNSSQQNARLQGLEASVAEHEQQREAALRGFESYKKAAEDREAEARADHASRIGQMAQEVSAMKGRFEERLNSMDSAREQWERDKQTALHDQEERHRKEMAELLQRSESQQGDKAAAIQELENKYSAELSGLHNQLQQLESEKVRLSEEYEHKMTKAQTFFEKELEALKLSQTSSHDEQLQQLRDMYEKLQKDSAFQEEQQRQRNDRLITDVADKESKIAHLQQELENLRHNMKNMDSNSSSLNQQLHEAKSEASKAVTRLKELEADLIASRERCHQQANDLIKKSTVLGELEATKLQNEATLQDVRAQLDKARDRIGWLEGAKRALESQTQSQAQEQTSHLKSLETALEEMSIQKQKQKEKYERDFNALQERSRMELERMTADHKAALEALRQTISMETQTLKTEAAKTLQQVKQDLESTIETEESKHRVEMTSLREDMDRTQTDLGNKLSRAEEEVARLEKIVRDSTHGLGTANTQVTSLQQAVERLKAELDGTRNELRAAKTKSSSLQSEYEKLKLQHDSKLTEHRVELKTKLDQLSTDLDNNWKTTLRKECEKLRREITAQKDEDKRAALEQLSRLKDAEMAAGKEGWESKVNELLRQVSELTASLDNTRQDGGEALNQLRQEAEAENQRLLQEMLESAQDYGRRIETLEADYKVQLDQLRQERDTATQNLERRLQSRHMEEMQAAAMAHRTQLDKEREEAGNQRQRDLDALREKNGQRLESLRTELEHKHALDLEQTSRGHQQHMQAARMELERALEVTRQKEAENAMHTSELQEEVQIRQNKIQTLEREIQKTQEGIRDMSHELDSKGKEILRIRSEANQAANALEEQLRSAHREDLQRISEKHSEEVRQMLGEVSSAQELLKEKISDLQFLLEEAEDRYRNRESRPEDLAAIERLQNAILEREVNMKRMIDEKKYYQMELVNRETNFNKVFNSTPNVGVLNPLSVKKPKSGDRVPMKFSSSPAIANRLDPLPGSPLHEERFNHMKPLPPSVKKFVK